MNATEERPEQIHAPEQPSTPPPAQEPPPPQAQARNWRPSFSAAAGDPRRKSPILACILSVIPGLGQVYVGYYKLGFIHMAVFASTMAVAASDPATPLIPLIIIFSIFFFLYNIVDAGRRAAFYNQALDGMAGVELPTDMSLPTPGGSVAGGVVLIAVGLILLSNTAMDIRLDWLEDWWPVAPILLGAWLLWRGMQEREAA
jgi:ABC-type nickel/cobalt efflux system permease component RcnA